MDNLKFKVRNTELDLSIKLIIKFIVGIAVIIIGLALLVFSDMSLEELWELGLAKWRQVKK